MRKKVIEKAISVAENLIHLPVGRSKHFSFIIKKNNIHNVSWNNSLKTHPLANKFGYRFDAIHSELSAVVSFNDLANAHKYEFLNLRFYNNSIGISRPCDKCQKLLIHYGFNVVTYSNKHGNFVTERFYERV